MKIVTGTLLITVAVFLLTFAESRPSNNEENMNIYNNNNNNNAARGRESVHQRVSFPGPQRMGVVHADFSQQSKLPYTHFPPGPAPVKTYHGPGNPLVNYEKNEKGETVGISHVILPQTAPGGKHTRVDYSYSPFSNAYPHPHPHPHPNP